MSLLPLEQELAAAHDYQLAFDAVSHTYTVNGRRFDTVTQILTEARMYRGYDGVEEAVLTRAGQRGTNVHLACQFLDQPEHGELDWNSLAPGEIPYVQSYDTFKFDAGFMPLAAFIERRMAHLVYQIAGTPDRIGYLRDGSLAVIDLKTGDVEEATRLQLAAYGFIAAPQKTFHRFSVRLRGDGRPQVTEYPLEEYLRDVQTFLSAATCVKWRQHYLNSKG